MGSWIRPVFARTFALLAPLAFLVPVETGAAPAALEIDRENSRIAARAQATGHTFDALATDYDLDVLWNPETGHIESARFSLDFSDVETGRERRDREMRDWLDYDTHPKLVFQLDRIDTTDESSPLAIGSLTFHGVEQPIAIPLTIEQSKEAVRIRGQTGIDHRDWDLDRIRAFVFMTVDPVLEVTFDIILRQPDSVSPD